jgi:hypothetical protein
LKCKNAGVPCSAVQGFSFVSVQVCTAKWYMQEKETVSFFVTYGFYYSQPPVINTHGVLNSRKKRCICGEAASLNPELIQVFRRHLEEKMLVFKLRF